MLRTPLLALASLALCPPAALPQGFGGQKLRCDAQALTAHAGNGNAIDDALLGVQYLGGHFYVTGRDAANAGGAHSIYVLDAACQRVRVFDQPAYTTSSAWGFRDGMSDGVGLAFGFEDGLGFLDAFGAPLTSFGGVALGSSPVVLAGYPAGLVYRALAFDAVARSVFVADFDSAIHELDLATGNLLHSWPNLAGGDAWSAYGLALDAQQTTPAEAALWVSGDSGSSAIRLYRLPRQGPGSTALATSARIARDQPLSAVGGLSEVPGGTPLQPIASAFDLVALDQGARDVISTYRVHAYATCNGAEDAYLVAGSGFSFALAEDDRARVDSVRFYPDDWIYWSYVEPQPSARFGAVWGNVKVTVLDETDDRLSTLLDPSFELRVAWGGSVPQGFLPLYLGPNVTAGGPPSAIPIPPGNFEPGEGLRLQGFFIDFCNPGFPIVATNQVRFVSENGFRPPVRVVAEGADSFDADPSRGFWRIVNEDRLGRRITAVTLDWIGSPNVRQATMRFDTDQVGMGSLFEGGNSALPGCAGTYRRGSDLATGLVYDASCTTPATPCDPGARTGWIGTNAGPSVEDWRTLHFRFTGFDPGEVFEFDADTDGGQGVAGGDMEGLRVRVELSDSTVLNGVLVAVARDRAQVSL
ncbi:MAG: hypothetical protein JNM84_20230 [Planctomycetes bacterium]|nr:hypothetical protein [Planctomycetota bacterium]